MKVCITIMSTKEINNNNRTDQQQHLLMRIIFSLKKSTLQYI